MQRAKRLKPEPTWEIAQLFPAQGTWSEEEYLDLQTNHLIEFCDGFLEFLPLPTVSHQQILAAFLHLLWNFVGARDLGTVLFAGLPVRLRRGKLREPDVLFMAKAHADRIREEYWLGADLVMEVVSGSSEDRRRDLVIKRQEYARAKIAEYWIVDPRDQKITVLRLSGKKYLVHGEFHSGDIATSHLLPGFEVDVRAIFAAATKPTRPRSRRRQP